MRTLKVIGAGNHQQGTGRKLMASCRRLFVLTLNFISTMRIPFALAVAGLLLAAAPALAAGRDGSARAPAPISALSSAMPTHMPNISIHRSGSIHSTNTVSANSGGNSGSNVVTGEQSSTVTVVNVAPANNDSVVVTDSSVPEPTSEPQCAGRLCPRTR